MEKKPLQIGNLKFEYPFVLAPLAGITDRSMRSLCSQAGASLTYTEMVSAKGLWYGDRKTGELLKTGWDGHSGLQGSSCRDDYKDLQEGSRRDDYKGLQEGPVGYQLFGCEPEILEYAARILSDPARAKEIDAEMAEAMSMQTSSGEDDRCTEIRTVIGENAGTENIGTGNSGKRNAASGFHPAVNRPPMGARTVAGLKPPALIDLNAGCPVPKIVRNGEGSTLLKTPDLLYECVAAMVRGARTAADDWITGCTGAEIVQTADNAGAAILRTADNAGAEIVRTADNAGAAIPVTVKIRKGFELGDDCAVEIAKAAEAAGAAAITVHGRSRQQFYDGKADWGVIARVKAAVNIPVIGNGDVITGTDAIRMIQETGCDGVMIARGALGNPWIFRDACALWDQQPGTESPETASRTAALAPTNEERIAMLLRHIDLVCEDKGEHIAVREMRKHVGWYIKGLHGATQIRRRINIATTIAEMKQILRDHCFSTT